MNPKQVKDFKEKYEAFLRGSNVNLGRKGTKNKEAFIAEAIEMVLNFISSKPDNLEAGLDDRLVAVKPLRGQGLVDSKGVAAMTDVKSRKADEELGRAPSFDQ